MLSTLDSKRTLGIIDSTPTEPPTLDLELSPNLALKLYKAYTNTLDLDLVKKIA